MSLQDYLDQHHISKYRLSKLSGVPMTTIIDIFSGKSDISRCAASTIQRLAHALNCTMEEIMDMASPYDSETGLPKDGSYLELGLPDFLQKSIAAMQVTWDLLDNGKESFTWDCDYCVLQSDINNAEVNGMISSEQAWYLREKYLRLERVG